MSFMYKTMMSRAPNKRKIKINEENLLSLMNNSDDEDEEDEDFTISSEKEKDKKPESDDEENSTTDTDESNNDKSDSGSRELLSRQHAAVDNKPGTSSRIRKPVRKRRKIVVWPTVKDLNARMTSKYYGLPSSTIEILTQARRQWTQSETAVNNMKMWPDAVCAVCLNEEKKSRLVTCQKCAVSVHEACYDVQHAGTRKNVSERIWICDSCVYGGDDVVCQFCPNSWGCMKETKCGRWVHIVCSRNILADFLYNMPGTSRKAFTPKRPLYIQLNDLNSKQFGQKECVLCEDRLVAKTGICIKCDAGLCKSSFHVTCAQRYGLLCKNQPNSNSGNTTDTHIANCPLHCDKEDMKKRQKNFILHLKTAELRGKKLRRKVAIDQSNVASKLSELRDVKKRQRDAFMPPRPPLEQVPRLLSSDAHFTKLLNSKAEKMFGISTKSPAIVIPKPTEIRKRHFVAPSLTTDFAAYFMDRQLRMEEEKSTLATAIKTNRMLSKQQEYERLRYNEIRGSLLACKSNRSDIKKEYESLKQSLLHLSEWAASGKIAQPDATKKKPVTPVKRKPSKDNSISPVSPPVNIPDAESIIDLKSCGICNGQENQHLLAKCDVCRKWQHLGCLDPPLTQMPKRTKYSLWQCSECADSSGSSSSESEMENRGSFTNQDGRRLTRRLRKAPEKLAIGFPYSPSFRRSKGMIGHSKLISKQQKRLREALTNIAKQQSLQKRMSAEHPISSKTPAKETEGSPSKMARSPKFQVIPAKSGRPTLQLGVSCDNYLSQAARIPIISQTRVVHRQPKPSGVPRQIRKIIILKKTVPVPHRPMGLGQSKKQVIFLKKHHFEKPKSPEKSPKKTEKICEVCRSAGDSKHIVSCETCKKNYHWKCCDPPLKSNPVSKFAAWECSDCVDKREEKKEENLSGKAEDSGSLVTPEGRRVISRKRKPPQVFQPAFNISNQQKIFKCIEKQNLRKIEYLANKKGTADAGLQAARCTPIDQSGWSPKRPRVSLPCTSPTAMQVLKSISGINLSSFQKISIVKKNPGKEPNIINLVQCQTPKMSASTSTLTTSTSTGTGMMHSAKESVTRKEKTMMHSAKESVTRKEKTD